MKNAFNVLSVRVFGIIALVAVIGFTMACGGGDDGITTVPVTGVSLDQPSLSLTVNGSATLHATVAPINATNQAVSWKSSNNATATVTNGTVTAIAEGSATITVTTADGGFTKTCTVTVGASSGEEGGTLTINNLPDGISFAVGVYNHSGTISDIMEWASVATNIIAVGSGTASSSMTLYAANTATRFTETGSYMVALYTTTVPTTVLYKTGVSFTNGNATVNYSEMTDLLGNAPDPGTGGDPTDPTNPTTKGKLTINNLPSGNSLAITIYNYDGEITSQTGLTTIQSDLTKLVAVSFGMANSSPASLVKSGGSTSAFDGTGTYLIIMAVNTTSLRYAKQVSFTDGCAEINFSTLLNMSDLPLMPVDPNQNPTASDFNIGNLTQTVGSVTAVTITPKGGKSTGIITIYYNGSTTLPTAAGTYNVTFDVAASTGWSAKTGLSAGTLTIIKADYIATSVADFGNWLAAQPNNNTSTAYTVVLNVNDLGGKHDTVGSVGYVLKANSNKYVKLDLSGSTFTSIDGGGAFFQCTNLTSVTLPNNVTSIGGAAFWGCTSLTNVNIPNNVTSLGGSSGGSTFRDCTSLTSIIIPDSVTDFGTDGTFQDCTKLASVTIGNGVTSIPYNAFSGCTSLTSLTIGNGITNMNSINFSDYAKLTDINVADNNASYSSNNGVLYNKDKTTLITYPQAKTNTSYSIPNSVKTIGGNAFKGCTNLTNVTIPNSVNTINDNAFSGCTNLTSVTIPNSVIYLSGFDGCIRLTNITIPSSVTSIGGSAFSGCTNLISVTIPNSVNTISYNAFSGCTNLTSITLPFVGASLNGTSYTNFGYIFGASSYNVNSSYVPASLKTVIITGGNSISSSAFYSCSSITSITIPDSVSSIGNYAFSYCNSLISVTFQGVISSSNIPSGDYDPFPGPSDLRTKYLAGGKGTYTRPNGTSTTWTKVSN